MSALKIVAGLVFVATVVAANYVTARYGMLPVGLGLMSTAGTYFAGFAFVIRDSLQDLAGKRAVIAAAAVGALVSYLVSDPFIALASGVAFLTSELVDLAVYTPLRKRGYVRAAVASNIVGALVDTVLFLWIAGFQIWSSVPGQMVGKTWITVAVVGAVVIARGVLRQPSRAARA